MSLNDIVSSKDRKGWREIDGSRHCGFQMTSDDGN